MGRDKKGAEYLEKCYLPKPSYVWIFTLEESHGEILVLRPGVVRVKIKTAAMIW